MQQVARSRRTLVHRLGAIALTLVTLSVAACGSAAVEPDSASDESAVTTTISAPAPTATTATTAVTTTSDASSTTTAPDAAGEDTDRDDFPVTVAGADIAERPDAIVSLSSTSTEMLFAIGAGDQVVAVDSFSNYPPEAPTTDLAAFEPNIEAIAEYEPDLVVVFSDPGDLVAGLTALDIPVIQHVAAASIDDAYTQLRELGAATGNLDGAETVIADMQARIDQAVADFDPTGIPDWPLTYYHEVDNTLYTATSSTFIGSIYGLFGLENIADPADADGSSFGFPQLSEEYIVEADPDIIFYGCALWCGTTPESIAERAGWSGMQAFSDNAVVELDDDIISRWGPRLVDFVELVGDTLESMAGPTP